jgi:DNA-binding NtrC family response regulator
VRIVASSRCDLEALVSEGKFHPGLLRLLGQQTIKVPALHERVEDIPMLVENFLGRYANERSEDYQQPQAPELSREAQRALLRHNWPGNVRELKNAVRRAAMLAKNQIINAEDLGLAAPVNPSPSAPPTDGDWQGAEGLKRPVWLN